MAVGWDLLLCLPMCIVEFVCVCVRVYVYVSVDDMACSHYTAQGQQILWNGTYYLNLSIPIHICTSIPIFLSIKLSTYRSIDLPFDLSFRVKKLYSYTVYLHYVHQFRLCRAMPLNHPMVRAASLSPCSVWVHVKRHCI